MGWLRRLASGFTVLISGLMFGLVVGFIGGLLRRRNPTNYVSDRYAPPADR